MIVAKCGNYVRKFMWQLCGSGRVDISLTVHSRAILKTVKSMCNDIKKIKCTLVKCHTNDNSASSTQLPHKFSYIVAILGHNNFESPNIINLKIALLSHVVLKRFSTRWFFTDP
jgi:hypothetical protein